MYLADQDSLSGGAAEVQRAIDISLMGAAGAGVATFFPEASTQPSDPRFAAAWENWLTTRFEPVLGPAFCRVHSAVGEMRIREILRADRDVDAALDEDEKQRSLAAAKAFLEGREAVRHMPPFAKLTAAIRNADCPGHVTTLFAMQSGLYHLPRIGALISYAWFEWQGGARSLKKNGHGTGGDAGGVSLEVFESQNPRTIQIVRDLLRGECLGGGAGESSIFRVE